MPRSVHGCCGVGDTRAYAAQHIVRARIKCQHGGQDRLLLGSKGRLHECVGGSEGCELRRHCVIAIVSMSEKHDTENVNSE